MLNSTTLVPTLIHKHISNIRKSGWREKGRHRHRVYKLANFTVVDLHQISWGEDLLESRRFFWQGRPPECLRASTVVII